MKPTRETYIMAAAFAASDGYNQITYECEFGGGVVYYATSAELENSCSGYPLYVLVTKGKNGLQSRYCTDDEALKILHKEK